MRTVISMRIFHNCNALIVCLTILLIAHREDALLVPMNKWIMTTKGCVKMNTIKIATAFTAMICICGLPTVSSAAEQSLESQLKQFQDIKVTNQKRRIEAAELELLNKELLYPEGRLIGRGIVKLMPETSTLQSLLY